jgi:LmbE family N-acetylglucosaminyl deacetylase
MSYSLLAIFAHPDDEAFGTGGTLSYYASQGVEVSLVCATRGEAGEIAVPGLATAANLGQVREDELRCSAETMGLKELIILDYRDSGMVGSVENQDPRAFFNAPSDEVIPRLVEIIRRIRPIVVTTFEPNGGYGHPDHIAIHKHTVAAFFAAADPTQFRQLGPAWQAKRLFFTAIPRSFFLEMGDELRSLGEDASEFDRFEDGSWPDEQVHVILDVSTSVDAKWSALLCHRTQFGPGNFFRRLPEARVKILMSKEHFAQAWPVPETGYQTTSLFTDL